MPMAREVKQMNLAATVSTTLKLKLCFLPETNIPPHQEKKKNCRGISEGLSEKEE